MDYRLVWSSCICIGSFSRWFTESSLVEDVFEEMIAGACTAGTVVGVTAGGLLFVVLLVGGAAAGGAATFPHAICTPPDQRREQSLRCKASGFLFAMQVAGFALCLPVAL